VSSLISFFSILKLSLQWLSPLKLNSFLGSFWAYCKCFCDFFLSLYIVDVFCIYPEFCILILYPATLLKVFTRLKRFW
jgi:hypothetical protein